MGLEITWGGFDPILGRCGTRGEHSFVCSERRETADEINFPCFGCSAEPCTRCPRRNGDKARSCHQIALRGLPAAPSRLPGLIPGLSPPGEPG